MPAVTAPNIICTRDDWTQLSLATIQSIQALHGDVGVIFADVKPNASIQVGEMGHLIQAGVPGNALLSNNSGGTAWGRAKNQSNRGRAIVTVTEV